MRQSRIVDSYGRIHSKCWQYDSNQYFIAYEPEAVGIHIAYIDDSIAYILPDVEKDEGIIKGKIPTAMLADGRNLVAYVMFADSTRIDYFIEVINRPIPQDYERVDDIPTWTQLVDKLNRAIEQLDDRADEIIAKYVEEHKDELRGPKGDPGDDGYSPKVTTQQLSDGVKVTIEDSLGQHDFIIKNGKDGEVDLAEIEQAIQDYFIEHPIVYPVTSVNNKTGDVRISANDVGAYNKTETDDKIHELNQYVVNEFAEVDSLLAEKEKLENKAETITGTNVDNTHYPSVKAITDWVLDRLPSSEEKSYWNSKADISDVEEAESTLHNEIQVVENKIPTKLNQLEDDTSHRTVTDEEKEKWNNVSIDTDNETITKTLDNKLQTVATKLVSGGYQNYWVGTKAEFNAIATKNPDTFYEVLDDEETALFEVDGTSLEFSSDNILRIPNNIDLMFQTMMYGNGESGYRKYRNGMLEQWGVATSSATGEAELSMHQPHIDTNFSIFVTPRERGNFFWYALPSAQQRFAVRIQSRDSQSMAVLFQWRSWGRWK